MEFTVDRTKWARRELNKYDGQSLLLHENGGMCCLGFVCVQLEIPNQYLIRTAYPSSIVNRDTSNVPIELVERLTAENFIYKTDSDGFAWYRNTELSSQAASINDNLETVDVEKEHLLKALFEEYGHTITFIN